MLRTRTARALSACVVGVCAAGAHAVTYSWQFTPGMPQPSGGGYGLNNDGGRIDLISTTFDSVSKALTFDVAFGPVGGNLVTRGYWLALNNGPNPKTNGGEMALFYFDASSLASPLLTTYVYNGVNGPNSWNDGNGAAAGSPAGDLIKGVHEMGSYVQHISAQDVGGQRLLRLTIDATDILSHVPAFPSPTDPWFGTGYDNLLGIWMHPVRSFNAAYEAAGEGVRGRITSLSLGTQGWLDGTNFQTQVPSPGTLALLGVGGVMMVRRRR